MCLFTSPQVPRASRTFWSYAVEHLHRSSDRLVRRVASLPVDPTHRSGLPAGAELLAGPPGLAVAARAELNEGRRSDHFLENYDAAPGTSCYCESWLRLATAIEVTVPHPGGGVRVMAPARRVSRTHARPGTRGTPGLTECIASRTLAKGSGRPRTCNSSTGRMRQADGTLAELSRAKVRDMHVSSAAPGASQEPLRPCDRSAIRAHGHS